MYKIKRIHVEDVYKRGGPIGCGKKMWRFLGEKEFLISFG